MPYSEIEHAEVYETNEELKDSLEELRKDYDRMETFLKGEIEALNEALNRKEKMINENKNNK